MVRFKVVKGSQLLLAAAVVVLALDLLFGFGRDGLLALARSL